MCVPLPPRFSARYFLVNQWSRGAGKSNQPHIRRLQFCRTLAGQTGKSAGKKHFRLVREEYDIKRIRYGYILLSILYGQCHAFWYGSNWIVIWYVTLMKCEVWRVLCVSVFWVKFCRFTDNPSLILQWEFVIFSD